VSATWAGFAAGGATLRSFYWGVGSGAGLDDVLRFHSVGLNSSASAGDVLPGPGQTVFSTVVAVDEAGRAIAAHSDGVRFLCGSVAASHPDVSVREACAGAPISVSNAGPALLCTFESPLTVQAVATTLGVMGDVQASLGSSLGV
jgi:hypothetical protein